MHIFRRLCARSVVAIALLTAAPALAAVPMDKNPQLTGADKNHAKSAFYFAEKSNWGEAVQHAARAKNPVLRDYMTWRAMLNEEHGYNFDAYAAFLARNPAWPLENRIRLRAENALFIGDAANVPAPRLRQWFDQHPPISGKGKMVYADMLAKAQGQSAKTTELIREAWVNGDFDAAQEKMLMLRHAKILRPQDHIARTDRLIWEGKYTAAGRMMFALPKGQQALFEARILLALSKPGVNGAIARVPANLRNDAGLLYERMQWRARKGLDDGVEELLLAAPATVPYPGKWWRARHIQVREALDSGRPSHAMKLLANHGQTDGIGQADALWLQGWISLSFLQQPKQAFGYFAQLEKAVSYPVSKSRGQYWMGRAAEAMGQKDVAHQWYTQAAAHNTTFYGQLGAAKAQKGAQLRLPQTARPTQAQLQQFLSDSRVKAVYMLAEMGEPDLAYTFIGHLMDEAKNHSEAVMTAELGVAIKRQDFAVQASKDAMKQHIVLPQTSYPHYRISFTPKIEAPMMWAITRQESLFNPNARSSADARGLMQVLPSTAREVARKNDMPYQAEKLEDATYNLRIGSAYIHEMVGNFNGSYILAIASYNAGPGRARRWVSEYGHPGRTPEEAIDWIERIPYSETRNYVQRVLENLQVYRAMLDPNNPTIRLEQDLVR